ncbi:MAG TPA: hypothetical protein VGM54_03045 [Chthoniobacter sp.]|jgi:uncharacterized cupredoxin-like copper-binding protein
MKTTLLCAALLAAALSGGPVMGDDQTPQSQKSLGQKTTDTLEKAKDTTVAAGRTVVNETKNAAGAVKDTILPDTNARKVDVTLTEHRIEMPRELSAGKTAFVVRNNGKERQNFKIEGPGLDREFILPVAPDESKTLDINLKPGEYKILVPGKESSSKGDELSLRVK